MKEEDIAILVTYRLEQAETALSDAQFLLDGNRSPQSVVNRSYYAMFHAAPALLQRTGRIPSKHTGVISIFDTEFVLKEVFPRELSRDFHKAFELRQVSDYKVVEPLTQGQAEEALGNARHFVEALKEHLATEGVGESG